MKCGYCNEPAIAYMTWPTIGRPKGAPVCEEHRIEKDTPDNFGTYPTFKSLTNEESS
jgi:hypothetical protein